MNTLNDTLSRHSPRPISSMERSLRDLTRVTGKMRTGLLGVLLTMGCTPSTPVTPAQNTPASVSHESGFQRASLVLNGEEYMIDQVPTYREFATSLSQRDWEELGLSLPEDQATVLEVLDGQVFTRATFRETLPLNKDVLKDKVSVAFRIDDRIDMGMQAQITAWLKEVLDGFKRHTGISLVLEEEDPEVEQWVIDMNALSSPGKTVSGTTFAQIVDHPELPYVYIPFQLVKKEGVNAVLFYSVLTNFWECTGSQLVANVIESRFKSTFAHELLHMILYVGLGKDDGHIPKHMQLSSQKRMSFMNSTTHVQTKTVTVQAAPGSTSVQQVCQDITLKNYFQEEEDDISFAAVRFMLKYVRTMGALRGTDSPFLFSKEGRQFNYSDIGL